MNSLKFKRYDVKYFLVVLVLLAGTIFRCLPFFVNSNKEIDVFDENKCSVVEIKAETESVGESFGTAVFVKEDGTLVTNSHVVTYKSAGELNVFDSFWIRFCFEDEYRTVTLIKYDSDLDLAVLKLDNTNCTFKPIKFANSDELKIGQTVFAIGNLNNVGISLTQGIVSNPKINVAYNEVTREVIQCDLTIAEGNSGGALVNDKGELIGITTFRLKDHSNNVIYGICYSLPANKVAEYVS